MYETDFDLGDPKKYTDWLIRVAGSEARELGEVTYVFVSDEYLLGLNKRFLDHDYYTDILTFDYSEGNLISGDIFISVDRVRENAGLFNVEVEKEFLRVMVHGLLHLFGYSDGDDHQKAIIRAKEEEKITLFHVEH